MKDHDSERELQRLQELLDRASPNDTRTVDRANAVVRKGKASRRRRGTAGAIAISAVAAVVIVGPHFLKTSPTTNEATDPSNGVDPTAPTRIISGAPDTTINPCPVSPVEMTSQTAYPDALSTGATSIRLCPAQTNEGQSEWVAPQDALVTNTDQVVAAFNDLPEIPAYRCMFMSDDALAPRAFSLRISYASGPDIVLNSFDWLCGSVRLNGTWVASTDLLDAFHDALIAQRDTLPPPEQQAPDCGLLRSPEPWMVQRRPAADNEVERLALAAATACAWNSRPSGGITDSEVLPESTVQAINDDFNAHSTIQHGFLLCLTQGPELAIVGVDAWGDFTVMREPGCRPTSNGPLTLVWEGIHVWQPTQTTLDLLPFRVGSK